MSLAIHYHVYYSLGLLGNPAEMGSAYVGFPKIGYTGAAPAA